MSCCSDSTSDPERFFEVMVMSPQLYDHAYGQFTEPAEAAVRRETYGEDIGQSSWMTAGEWLHFADQLGIRAGHNVLEIGSGSGGPAAYLAAARQCNVTGVDINEHGVRNARDLAYAKGLDDRLRFEAIDASRPLPFPAASFATRRSSTRSGWRS